MTTNINKYDFNQAPYEVKESHNESSNMNEINNMANIMNIQGK